MPDNSAKDSSPFPSGPEMDLDMWRATAPKRDGSRWVRTPDAAHLIKVYGTGTADSCGLWARRIEALGDLYEGLRRAAEKMSEAGINVDSEHGILSDFITPKPFAKGE